MSASVSGMRGGAPSTTQPIAGPWLSPKVVTRKRWPKVLWDMESRWEACANPIAVADSPSWIAVCRQKGDHVDAGIASRCVDRGTSRDEWRFISLNGG